MDRATELLETIESLRKGEDYQVYLDVRGKIFEMMACDARDRGEPSRYWQEEVAGFEYMFDASPLIIHRFREHCYHLTGIRSFDYRAHHAHQKDAMERKLRRLMRADSSGLLVSESTRLGGFGHRIGSHLVNLDTLKFYESLIALDKSCLLEGLQDDNGMRKCVVEIGGGWGGFAHQFKTLFPDPTYIILDLPETLLFSGFYISALFPDASIGFCANAEEASRVLARSEDFDFVFLPHYLMGGFDLPRLELAINMVSFQEMTSEQVEGYARRLWDGPCRNIYSLNRDRSPHNPQLSTVSGILSKFYDVREVRVLEETYEQAVPAGSRISSLTRRLRRRPRAPSVYRYRHLKGVRKAQPG